MNIESRMIHLESQFNRVVAAYTTHVQQTNHAIRELQQNTMALAKILESLQTAMQQMIPPEQEEPCH